MLRNYSIIGNEKFILNIKSRNTLHDICQMNKINQCLSAVHGMLSSLSPDSSSTLMSTRAIKLKKWSEVLYNKLDGFILHKPRMSSEEMAFVDVGGERDPLSPFVP